MEEHSICGSQHPESGVRRPMFDIVKSMPLKLAKGHADHHRFNN